MTPFVEQSAIQKNNSEKFSFSDAIKNDNRMSGSVSSGAFSELMSNIQPFVSNEQGLRQVPPQERGLLKEKRGQDPFAGRAQHQDERLAQAPTDCQKQDNKGQPKVEAASPQDGLVSKSRSDHHVKTKKDDSANDVDNEGKEESTSLVSMAHGENGQLLAVQNNTNCQNDTSLCLGGEEAISAEKIEAEAFLNDATNDNIDEAAVSNVRPGAEGQEVKVDDVLLQLAQNETIKPISLEGKKTKEAELQAFRRQLDIQKDPLSENLSGQLEIQGTEEIISRAGIDERLSAVKGGAQEKNNPLFERSMLGVDKTDCFETTTQHSQGVSEKAHHGLLSGANTDGLTKAINGLSNGLSAQTGSQQQLIGSAAPARPMGLYSHASQLSATRVANGGATGLPHVIEQVSVQLHKAAVDGQREVVINLKPAELGKIEIKLEITVDNKVTGTVCTESQAVLNLIQKDAAGLHRALQEAGLQTDPSCLQFSLKEENGNSQFAHQNKTTRNEASGLVADETPDGSINEGIADGLDVHYLIPGRVNLRV